MQLGRCVSIDTVLIKIYAHCSFVALYLLLIHTLICTWSTRHSFRTSPGLYQDQASTSAKWEHTQTNTHTCFHLYLSSDCMSQCLGRKIGLCRAERLAQRPPVKFGSCSLCLGMPGITQVISNSILLVPPANS